MNNFQTKTNDMLSPTNNNFIFENPPIEALTDISHTTNGDAVYSLFIKSNSSGKSKKTFSFNSQHGLYFVNDTHTKNVHDVINDLIKLRPDNYEQFNSFFQKYGFLFMIAENETLSIKYETVTTFIMHFTKVFHLLTELNKSEPDLDFIYELTTSLLFSNTLTTQINGKEYQTCTHIIKELLFNVNDFYYPDPTIQEGLYNIITIDDSLSKNNQTTFNECDWLDEEIQYVDENNDLYVAPYYIRFRQLLVTALYLPKPLREIIEFYYHIEFMQLKNIYTANNISSPISYCDTPQTFNNNLQFTEVLKERLIKIAHYTINEEVEHILKNLQPRFNSVSMSARWHIPDLYTALFFSLIYLDNDNTYRICENKYCNEPFFVSSTNKKKKYCCSACARAVATRNYQKRRRVDK